MDFAKKLKKLRKLRGLSQTDLGNKVGVSLQTITNYETNKRLPKRRATYEAIANCLEVDPNFLLFDFEDDEEYLNDLGISSKLSDDSDEIDELVESLDFSSSFTANDSEEKILADLKAYLERDQIRTTDVIRFVEAILQAYSQIIDPNPKK